MAWLPDGEKKIEDMYNRLDTIPACDRRTDRRTSCHGIVRAMHTRRVVKICSRVDPIGSAILRLHAQFVVYVRQFFH